MSDATQKKIHNVNNNYFSTSWNSQPYTGGSYTAIGNGGTQKDIEKVAEPLFVKTKKSNKVRNV